MSIEEFNKLYYETETAMREYYKLFKSNIVNAVRCDASNTSENALKKNIISKTKEEFRMEERTLGISGDYSEWIANNVDTVLRDYWLRDSLIYDISASSEEFKKAYEHFVEIRNKLLEATRELGLPDHIAGAIKEHCLSCFED